MDEELKFPLHFFHPKLQEILIEVAQTYSYPIDYVCCSVLVTASTAIGNSTAIQIKNNWIERPSIFMALIGPPGINKSAPLSWAMIPLEKKEKQLYKTYLQNVKDYDHLNDKEKQGKTEPILVKTIVSDATPEALVQQMKLNDRGVLILLDELSGFLNSFQRYNKGNDEQFYLSAWSGKPVIVDRKMSRPVRISEPVLNIIGTIQPGVMEKSFSDKEESGFYDRWLLCYPKSAKKEFWNDFDLNYLSQSAYERIINKLTYLSPVLDEWENITPRKLNYYINAMVILKAWQINNTNLVNKCEDDIQRAIRAKMEIYIHRFALICELTTNACEDHNIESYDISQESVMCAISLCEYFIKTAIDIRTGDKTENLPILFKNLMDVIPIEIEFTFQQFMERAEFVGLPESTARKWLKRNTGKDLLFYKIKHGLYGRS